MSPWISWTATFLAAALGAGIGPKLATRRVAKRLGELESEFREMTEVVLGLAETCVTLSVRYEAHMEAITTITAILGKYTRYQCGRDEKNEG